MRGLHKGLGLLVVAAGLTVGASTAVASPAVKTTSVAALG